MFSYYKITAFLLSFQHSPTDPFLLTPSSIFPTFPLFHLKLLHVELDCMDTITPSMIHSSLHLSIHSLQLQQWTLKRPLLNTKFQRKKSDNSLSTETADSQTWYSDITTFTKHFGAFLINKHKKQCIIINLNFSKGLLKINTVLKVPSPEINPYSNLLISNNLYNYPFKTFFIQLESSNNFTPL